MRIYCKCGERAILSKTKINNSRSTELYCSCSNAECGHSFVSKLTYKHALNSTDCYKTASLKKGRVFCSCGSVARITKTNRLSNDCADLYCSCKSCNHKFVMSLYYSYSLSPSSQTTNALSCALVKSLSPFHLKKLQEQLSLF